MNQYISTYLRNNYEESKGDLFAAFISRLGQMCIKNGYYGLVTQRTWLFLSAFEKLREHVLRTSTGLSFIELGAGAFDDLAGEVVQSVIFTMQKRTTLGYITTYIDLTNEENKEYSFSKEVKHYTHIDDFSLLPGYTFAMKLSDHALQAYKLGVLLREYAKPKKGLISSDNNRFLRFWFEVSYNRIQFGLESMEQQDSHKRWLPHNKGGSFRRWYGNHDYIINWEQDGYEVKEYAAKLYGSYSRQIMNEKYYLKESLSWSSISSQKIGVRYYPTGFVFDTAGPSIFISDHKINDFVFGLLSSCVAEYYIKATNPTINLLASDIANLPVLGVEDSDIRNSVSMLVNSNVSLGKADWDSYETSWEFRIHPLLSVIRSTDYKVDGISNFKNCCGSESKEKRLIENDFMRWSLECKERYLQLKLNEESLNKIFINIYNLQNELKPDVANKDITVRLADLRTDICSFISYAVGCMFGRYSLDADGLAFAGGSWDSNKYKTFIPDEDNCIPITDEPYFEDDIVGRFVDFIRIVYGADTLEENLSFIANALGNKGNSSREVIRNYFLNDFFKDHIKVYQKRPIYWLFDSGKQNGFKALVYMHRWNADTVGNLRVEYLHKMQRVYEKEIERMQDIIENGNNSREINQASKRREKLTKQLKEARDYDTKIAHVALSRVEIDLDDGVKVNYEKVQRGPDGKSLGILAKI